MKRILLTMVLISGIVFGQQIPQFSQYLRNQSLLNPGAVGAYDFTDVTIGGRWQWAGFTNAPMTGYASVSAPIRKRTKPKYNPSLRISDGLPRNPEVGTGKLKHAVGGQFVADQYGAFRSMYFSGTYALHIPMGRNYNLSFGTKLGLSNNAFLPDRAQVLNSASDNVYQAYTAENGSVNIFDIGAGLYFYSKQLFIGIATDHLAKDFVSFGTGVANFDRKMHFNFIVGYKFFMNEDWSIMPTVMAKYMTPAPVSINGTVQVEYKEFLWFGVGYRYTDAVIGMIGVNISERFKIGYSFDYSTSKFNNVSSGGHEFVLGLMLGR